MAQLMTPLHYAAAHLPRLLPAANGGQGGKGNNGGSSGVTTDEVLDPAKKVDVPPDLTEKLSKVISFGSWIVFTLAIAGVLLCAAQMAIARKNGGEAGIVGLVWALVGCSVAAAATGIVGVVV